MILEGDWEDLARRGYLVGRSLLGDDALQMLRRDYEVGSRPDCYFLGLKPLGLAALDRIGRDIAPVLAAIREHTGLEIDALLKGYYFATQYVNYSWHQDFDLLAHDLVNYVNFYVPITKPSQLKTNLTLVPYDSLRQQSETAYHRLKNGSGTVIERVDRASDRHRVVDARDRSEYVIDVSLDHCAVTPELSEGDLLILRSDVIHRTQDADTDRLAVSIRIANSKSVIRRQDLERSGLLRRRQDVEAHALEQCLDAFGRNEVTMAEFIQFSQTISAAEAHRQADPRADELSRTDEPEG